MKTRTETSQAANPKKWRFQILMIPSLLLLGALLMAQPKPSHFENLSVREGLSNNWVRPGGNILQDTTGFLWVGTQNGLNRYDGTSFKVYQHNSDDPSSLSDNNIWALYLDPSHKLWVATNKGVDRYDPLKDQFVHYQLLQKGDAPTDLSFSSAMLADTHGNFLLGTGVGLYQLDQRGQFINTELLPSCWVSTLLEDKQGQLWVGARESQPGLFKFNWLEGKGYTLSKQFYQAEDGKGLQDNRVLKVFEDSQGDIWIATFGGLDLYEQKTNSFTHFLSGHRINDIEEGAEGQLWITVNVAGLYAFDRERKEIISHRQTPSTKLTDIYLSKTNELWVGSLSSGLYYHNEYFPAFTAFGKDPDLFFSLSSNHIKDQIRQIGTYFFEQQGGSVWVASKQSIYRFDENDYSFSRLEISDRIQSRIIGINERVDESVWIQATHGLYLFTPHEERITPQLENQRFQYFIEDNHGNLWLDDEKGRSILRIHPTRDENYITYPICQHNPGIRENRRHITFIQEDSNENIWIGTVHGLYRYDQDTDTTLSCRLETGPSSVHPQEYFFGFYEDSQKRQWTYTDKAVYRFLPDENSFVRYAGNQEHRKGLSSYTKISFYEDSQEGLWVTTMGGGLNKYDEKRDAFIAYRHDINNPNSISNNDILNLYEDSQKRLWVATKGGLNRWNPESEAFTRWTMADGLIANDIGSILEDQDQLLWLGTGGGLSKFDPKNNFFSNYTYRDGLPDNYLFWNIHYITQKGTIFFVQRSITQSLFFVFHPKEIQKNPHPPRIAFTGFQLFHKPIPIRETADDTLEWKSPLLQHITYTKKIELSHWQNDFSVEFAALEFLQPQNHTMLYKLEGYNKHWIEAATSKNRADYTNIAPGNYTFQVKAANNDGVWNEEGISLDIIIQPPWYWAWWSKILYLMLISGFLLGIYYFQLNRRLALAEAKRLRDLDEVKTQLYTNITHEFRTPLTVILGMADRVADDPRKWFREGLDMIKRNGHNMLRLINQMLDLRKLESGNLSITMIQGNIIAFLNYIIEPFYFYAEAKSIKLLVNSHEESLWMDFNPERMKEIISNLLSNAIKFTPEGGEVHVTISRSQRTLAENWLPSSTAFELKIKDTGVGMTPQQIPHIFDRFYQADGADTYQEGGTGIGLALTKELIKLLGGNIVVSSELGVGTEFIVCLPINRTGKLLTKEAWTNGNSSSLSITTNTNWPLHQDTENRPLILIVEDHNDVMLYLKSCLEMDYQLVFASDGQEGGQKARELIPDLIVSDIMMSKKDGYTLTSDLKKNHLTSHIPIILLTARADQDSRMHGLEKGADAYLTKPFYPNELLIRIKKLIELRKSLQQHYQKTSLMKPQKRGPNDIEYAFLNKINATIEDHLSDENFGIPQFCRAVGISRTQLHRKLKALTGKSTSQYIRRYRLLKAKDLLLASRFNVSEVSMQVGFKHLSHFTAAFKKEFGITPSEWGRE